MVPFVLPFSLLLLDAVPPPSVRMDPPRPAEVRVPPVIHVEAPQERVARMHREREAQRARRATFAVEVTGGGQMLWSGTLRVGSYGGGANVNRSTRQAPPYGCPVDMTGRYRSEENSFRLDLNMQNYGDDGATYNFSVNWQRPSDDCSDALVQRSVQLSGNASLAPGQSVTIQGDAGLVLKLKLVSEVSTERASKP